MDISRQQEDLVGPGEAAELLGVGVSTIQRWIDAGKIPAHRTLGGHRRVLRDDLVRFAKREGIPLKDGTEEAKKGGVLIVDDDESIHVILEAAISKAYPETPILHAYDGFEAGVRIMAYRPKTIFLDIRMPGIDGIRVCQLIKADERTKDSIVVGITGVQEIPELTKLIDAGAEEVLRKPFDPERLQMVMYKYLRTL